MEPSEEHLNILKKYFGHKEFRPLQWKIISSVIHDRRDNCVIMATGYGKSLCYQYPPVFCKGVAIVISPLISLMEDQVLALEMCNVPATLLGSAQHSTSVLAQILGGEFRVVYASPEWITGEVGSSFLQDMVNQLNVTLVAIDEAHCVSQWGFDFRMSYRKLRIIRNLIGPNIPMLAVTATATETVKNDIISVLHLRNPLMSRTICDRPNLYLSASIKGDDPFVDIRDVIYQNSLKTSTKSSCIVYCRTKKEANKIADRLTGGGITCALYHADLSLSARKIVHRQFVSDKVNIIVATIAFGMGIDKPDVRLIIHYGAPKDIESYYQEIGRAGRDGLPSVCHVIYKDSDFNLNRYFLQNCSGPFLVHKEQMMKLMEEYLVTLDCRRVMLVHHFDPEAEVEKTQKCCDNCTKQKLRGNVAELKYDLTEDALLLMNAVNALFGKYGLQMSICLLRGSFAKRLPTQFQSSPFFGKGRAKCDNYWKLLGNLLIREGLLDKVIKPNSGWNVNQFPYHTIALSHKGNIYLCKKNSRDKVKLTPTLEMVPLIKNFMPCYRSQGEWLFSADETPECPPSEVDASCLRKPVLEEMVFKELDTFRCQMASRLNCMPYLVLKNVTLQILSTKRPTTLAELSAVEGITEKDVQTFGQACLDCIEKCVKSFDDKNTKKDTGATNTKRFKKKVIRYESTDGGSASDLASQYESADDASMVSSQSERFFLCQTVEDSKQVDSLPGSPSTVASFYSTMELENQDNPSKAENESQESSDHFFAEDNDLFELDYTQLVEKRKNDNRNEERGQSSSEQLLDDDDDLFTAVDEKLLSPQKNPKRQKTNLSNNDKTLCPTAITDQSFHKINAQKITVLKKKIKL